jgi:hypothetical protein
MSYIPPHVLEGIFDDAFYLLDTLAKQAMVNKEWNAIVQPKLDSLKIRFLQAVIPGLDIEAGESLGVSSSGLVFLLMNTYDEAAFVPGRIFRGGEEGEATPSTAHFLKNGLALLNGARNPVMWCAWACLYLTYLIREPRLTSIHEVLNIKYQAAKHHAIVPKHLWARLQSSACELIDNL